MREEFLRVEKSFNINTTPCLKQRYEHHEEAGRESETAEFELLGSLASYSLYQNNPVVTSLRPTS